MVAFIAAFAVGILVLFCGGGLIVSFIAAMIIFWLFNK